MSSLAPARPAYEDVPCPLCGAQSVEPRWRIPNRTHPGVYVNSVLYPIAEAHTIVRCRRCGLLFASPRLARGDGLWTYSEAEAAAYFAAPRADRRAGNDALLRTLAAHGGRGRLLDAGCGDGLLLAQAAARGWQAWGIERSHTLAEGIAHGTDPQRVLVGDVAGLPFPSEAFDVVTLINVIEHVPDPVAVLAEAARVTRAQGLIAVHAPNAGGLGARLRGARWHQYDPVEHLVYFTRRTLRMALERHGLEVISTFELPGAATAKRVLAPQPTPRPEPQQRPGVHRPQASGGRFG